MNLRADQLPARLKRGLDPVTIISGDETLLVQEAADAVRAAARAQGFTEREVLDVAGKFDWERFLGAARSMSLFAERRLLELRMPNGKPGDAGSKALQAYVADPDPDTLLLIVCNRIESSGTRSKWYRALETAGCAVQVWPVDFNHLPRWIEGRLRSQGLDATPEAARLLAERSEGNLLAAVQEIEKLALAGIEGRLDAEAVTAAVADNARFDLFSLVDRALAGESAHSLRTLHGLRAEGTAASLVLWALSREIRSLCQCAWQLERGSNMAQALSAARVWDRRKSLVQGALKRLSRARLDALLLQCRDTDGSIKGADRQDPWERMADITLQLSGATGVSNLVATAPSSRITA